MTIQIISNDTAEVEIDVESFESEVIHLLDMVPDCYFEFMPSDLCTMQFSADLKAPKFELLGVDGTEIVINTWRVSNFKYMVQVRVITGFIVQFRTPDIDCSFLKSFDVLDPFYSSKETSSAVTLPETINFYIAMRKL